MATSNRTLTRIYDLRVLGGDNVSKALKTINQALEENAKLKAMASKNSVSATELAEMEKYKVKIKELTVEELKLKAAQKEALNEKRAMAVASSEAANASKKEKDALVAAQGSYAETVKIMKELRPLIQNANAGSSILFQGKKIDFSQAIAEYKKLSAAEQDFRRQFTKDNTLVGEYTSGIIKAFQDSGLDTLIAQQVKRTKDQIGSLDKSFEDLKKELSSIGVTGKGGFERIEQQMIENRNEAEKLRASLAQVESQMSGVGGVGRQVTTAINQGFTEMRKSIGNVVVGYIGFQAALNQGTKLIGDASEISDQLTELEVNMGGTADAADDLKNKLKAIDTRTSLKSLLEISDVALKAGASRENLAGIAESIDKIKVAFGKDFGSVEQGTEDLTKLIKIFYEGEGVTGERMLKVGNSIRAVANESEASVDKINDFNMRMSGLKQMFQNFELSQSIGLGAGFQSLGISMEVASTTLNKVLPKISTDTEKYGKIVGMTAEEFGKLINANPTEALLQVSEALIKSGSGVEEISKALEDSELGSGRITQVLAALGGRTEVFRNLMGRAGETIESTDAITAAFAAKNENLAAKMDKLSKTFNDIAGNKNFQNFLYAVATAFGVLATVITNIPWPILVAGLTLATASFMKTYIATQLATQGTFLFNAQLILQRAYTVVANGVLIAYYGTIALLTGGITRSTIAMRIFNTVIKASPLGLLLTVVGVLAGTFVVFAGAVTRTNAALSENAKQALAVLDVNKQATMIYAEQIAQIDHWVAVIKSGATSADTKRKAVEELTKIDKAFGEVIKDNVIDLTKLEDAYKKVTDAIKKQATVQAASAITASKQKKVVDVATTRMLLEQTLVSGDFYANTSKTDIPKEILDIIKTLDGVDVTRNLDMSQTIAVKVKDQQKVFAALAKAEKEATNEFLRYNKVKEDAIGALEQAAENAGGTNGEAAKVSESVFQRFARFMREGGTESDIQKLRDDIKKQKEGLNMLSKEYKDLVALEKQIEEFLNPKNKAGGVGKTKTENLRAEYEAEKKVLETQFNDKVITEQQFEESLLKLATDFRERRLTAIKAANKKEKEQQISFNAELSKDQAEANNKLFEILSQQSQAIMDQRINQAKIAEQGIDDDPQANRLDKLNAKLQLYKVELEAKRKFDNDMLSLEERFRIDNVKSAAKRRDELAEIERQIRKTAYEVAVASYNERMRLIEEYNKTARGRIETQTNNEATDILRSGKSPREQANALKELEFRKTKELLEEEVRATKAAQAEIEKARRNGLATQKEVDEAKNKSSKARLDYERFISEQERSVLDQLTAGLRNAWSNISGFFRGVKASQDEIIGAVNKAKEYISGAISNAKEAYFSNQQEQIDREKENTLTRIDLEEQQVMNMASSEEEKESIRRLYDDKRKEAERKASEEKKQVALKQAAMDYAMGMIKTLAAYPFPFSLIPMAGLTIAYLFQRAQIQKQKFEKGGVPTKTGGPINGPSHRDGGVPFNYEAEGGELAIINKRSTALNKKFTVTGTPKQIASAINQIGGGVSFANGAKIRRLEYGGMLGSNLRAPADTSFLRGYGSNADDAIASLTNNVNIIAGAVQSLAIQTNDRIDNISVSLLVNDVTDKQGEIKKAKSVGQLK